MYQDQTVSVVIPAYNEEGVIEATLDKLLNIDQVDEIIVVDDGSSDRTREIVGGYPDVTLVAHPYNIGNGAAVKSGIRAANCDIIIMMDSDGQHPPEEIPNMLPYIDQYDMVVGARGAGTDSQLHRNIANRVFNWYASYIVGYPIPDLTSGFRVIRTEVIRSFLYLLPNQFSYPTTLTISLFRAGYAVKYHSFVSPARKGHSKIKAVRDGLRFLLTITRMATLFVPLKIFLPISMIFILGGGGYTLSQLTMRRFSGFGGLIFTIGVLIFILGLIAEQIAMLRYVNSDR